MIGLKHEAQHGEKARHLRREIHKVLSRQYGLCIQMEAVKYLQEVMEQFDVAPEELHATLELIAQTYFKHRGKPELPFRL
jgi:hypothetical protein